MLLIDHCNANTITLVQWCSGNFFLVGTLALHYGHKPYWGGGGGGGAGVPKRMAIYPG